MSVDKMTINGPSTPPAGYEAQRAPITPPELNQTLTTKTLTVPAFNWVFGCSSVSGAMIAGYYDRNGFPNIYTGPTNGGVTPLNNSSWGTWSDGFNTYPNIPLAASHKGVDGRTLKGSVDDYWVKYGSSTSDPYVTGSWTQHTWGTAIGDYMKTSQSAYGNTDGSTMFYTWTTSATPLTCADMVTNNIHNADGTYGRKLFYQARGYTVTTCYNQKTDNNGGGFTYAMFKAEINAGRPVMLNLAGHTIVGVGYNDPSTIYIHDTWDYLNHSMTWGGSYSGMQLLSVSIVNIAAPSTAPVLVSPSGTITDRTPTYTWKKVTGATQYRYQVYRGTTLVYTKTVASSVCGTTNCTNTPTTLLNYAAHKWHAQALVGGVWKTYSAYKNFTVSAPATGFNSQFTSDTTGWTARKGTWGLSSGNYKALPPTTGWSSSSHTGSYSTLTYQARMKIVGCATSSWCTAHLSIRGVPLPLDSDGRWSKEYKFVYDSDGYFSVWEVNSLTVTALKTWTSSTYILPTSYNTVKVTATGSTLKFYINGHLLWSGTDASFTNGNVGLAFQGNSGSYLMVDWATLATSVASSADEVIELGEERPGGSDILPPTP
jgi:hypothetical protein